MPKNKRQHYVPQNYLRGFSAEGENIGVFLIDTSKCIDNSPINSQAQESYFYGKNLVLEKRLSELEGLLADNRRTVFECTRNKLSLYQREVLYQDMLLQLSRTKQMANFYEEIATTHARRLWGKSDDEWIRKHANDFGIKFDNPIITPMMTVLKNSNICIDLKFKVLINKTGIPFITSDNPVCRYNQFFEALRRCHSGLSCMGEELYYPLSPSFAVIYYDGNVYKTKYRKRSYLKITDNSDVNNLNGLVCAWANKCIYYNPKIMRGEHVAWTFDQVKDSRSHLHKETNVPAGKKSNIIIGWHPIPVFHLYLTFLKFQKKAKPHH